jgi:hypothetical protein
MTAAQGYPLARKFFGLQAREPFLKFKPRGLGIKFALPRVGQVSRQPAQRLGHL